MMTSRRMEAGGLTKKIRELDDRKKGPVEITQIRETWEAIQNRLHDQLGIARVSCKTLEAQGIDKEATLHMGVSATAMERKGEASELGDINREITARNAERDRLKAEHAAIEAKIIDLDAERAKRADAKAIRSEAKTLDPERILASLTERRATFTRADLNRHLREFLPDARARSAFMDRLLAQDGVIPLRENEQAPVSRYTTRDVLDGEGRVMDTARRLAHSGRHGVTDTKLAEALDYHAHLDREQREALHRATGAEGLAIVAGEAGTGKSTTLAAIREAYEAGGYRVTGLAWTNAVVQNMRGDGFRQAETIQSALMRQKNGRAAWDRRSVLMVDEAAMISTKHLAALLTAAETSGAKVILAGDEKQLSSIERGGMFAALRREHGAAELHAVRRVKDDPQREAFNAMHRGDFAMALKIFDQRGAIHWSATPEASRAALVRNWAADTAADPSKTRFVLAYTNAEVAELNRDLRAIRRERDELGEDRSLKTRDGEQDFAVNDRVQFTASATHRHQRQAGLFNGAAGTVLAIDGARLTVALDTEKGAPPRLLSFNVGGKEEAGEFDAIRHGYAGTIYKAQGRTLDQNYVLHSDNWRAATGYVALSRHREDVKLFAAEKSAPWIMAEGGLEKLTAAQRLSAEKSFAAWKEAKPDLAAKYGFANYVGYVQNQWADQKRLDPLDRLARQMGRVEETRAASQFVEGAKPPADPGRKPPLSIVAGIVGDYLRLCYDPAKDWLRWIAEDLRHKATSRRAAANVNQQGRDDAHTERARPVVEDPNGLWKDALHELQGRVDPLRGRRPGVDGLSSGPRADPRRDDGLRPVREPGLDQPALPEGKRLIREDLRRARESVTRREPPDAPGKTPNPGGGPPRGRHR